MKFKKFHLRMVTDLLNYLALVLSPLFVSVC